MTFSKKHCLLPVSVILTCLLLRGFYLYSVPSDSFSDFCEEITMDILEDNPFEMHYSIADPKAMGLEHLSQNLTAFSPENLSNSETIWNSRKEQFSQIDVQTLSEEDQYLYHLLDRYMDLNMQSLCFPYYERPLSLSGGVHSQLPLLLSEYAFRTKEDIEQYLHILSQVPDYLQGILSYCSLQQKQGILLYEKHLQTISEQCHTMFPEEQLEDNTHFLQVSFQQRLNALQETKQLTQAEYDTYLTTHDQLLHTRIVPAYERLADGIARLQGTATLSGLGSSENGTAYYELLLQDTTGSSRSVEEIRSMLYERYQQLYETYQSLLQEDAYTVPLSFSDMTPAQMLTQLYESSKEDFPSLEALNSDAAQQVLLKKVDGILADMSAPAFYLTPPIDANQEHTIYINPNAELEQLELYTTLAHEGFPGHLYQTVYAQTALSNKQVPLLRHLLYYGGFTEGWAIYAELYAYNYAAKLISNQPTAALYHTLERARCNREIQLCICSLLDIYIHYDQVTLPQVKDLLQALGLNSAAAESVYETICDSPCNYPKYYVGYLEILNLKEQAKQLWGEAYSEYRFHQWILESGGGDFESLTWLLTT